MAKKPFVSVRPSSTKTNKPLPEVFQRMYDHAAMSLKVLNEKFGIEYAIYSDDHKLQAGNSKMIAVVDTSHRKRAPSAHPVGAMAAVYIPVLSTMQPDDYGTIPIGIFNPSSMQSAVSARASQLWGNGTYSAVMSKDRTNIEIWRYPEGITNAMIGLSNRNARLNKAVDVTDDE